LFWPLVAANAGQKAAASNKTAAAVAMFRRVIICRSYAVNALLRYFGAEPIW
jgi:hypothetical protein